MSSKVVYLFPTAMEASSFQALMPDAEVVISGVGMVATSATLVRLCAEGRIDRESLVVLSGVAGSYGEGVAKGEVVEVVEERCIELPERFRTNYTVPKRSARRGVVSNCVHRSGAECCGAEVENMEGASLFALADVLGFRAMEIRAISNIVGEPFHSWRMEEAVVSLARVLIEINEEMICYE